MELSISKNTTNGKLYKNLVSYTKFDSIGRPIYIHTPYDRASELLYHYSSNNDTVIVLGCWSDVVQVEMTCVKISRRSWIIKREDISGCLIEKIQFDRKGHWQSIKQHYCGQKKSDNVWKTNKNKTRYYCGDRLRAKEITIYRNSLVILERTYNKSDYTQLYNFTYDEKGRCTHKEFGRHQKPNGLVKEYDVTYEYFDDSAKEKFVYPDGLEIVFRIEYNPDGSMKSKIRIDNAGETIDGWEIRKWSE